MDSQAANILLTMILKNERVEFRKDITWPEYGRIHTSQTYEALQDSRYESSSGVGSWMTTCPVHSWLMEHEECSWSHAKLDLQRDITQVHLWM